MAYIGESSNIPSRLYSHERTYGKDALFAYAELTDLDASHRRQEIETDLIGTYYLQVGESPLAQWTYEERSSIGTHLRGRHMVGSFSEAWCI